MADEEVVVTASSAPSDHKRKLVDLEPQEEPKMVDDLNSNPKPNTESDSVKKADGDEEEEEEEEETVTDGPPEAKRPRSDSPATENGYQMEKLDEPSKEDNQQSTVEDNNQLVEDAEPVANEAPGTVKNEQASTEDNQTEGTQQHTVENPLLENAEQEPSGEKLHEAGAEVTKQVDASADQQPESETQSMSRKMEVPNNKVGVLIGKAGDTIRLLQHNSGAKIQIMRDADADPGSATRPVELIGTLDSISKAEKLIMEVIAEADAGGSPSLVARGFSTHQSAGPAEQLQIQVPNEKVGLIIGKGGETIKNLQTRSGARIQVLIPQHLPEGDHSKERTVRVTGDKKQIEIAREMIKDVMNQPVRPSPLSSGYNQQGFRPRGPPAPSQWGIRGPHPSQPTGYDYQQRGPYSSQNPQYPPTYGNYPPQQQAPRSSFAPGWEQRPPATMQGPPQSGGYDYYGGQGGHMTDAPSSAPLSNPAHAHAHASGPSLTPAMGAVPTQATYNYGQQHGPNYGQPAPYSQAAPPQSYGHGYSEAKYENQAPTQHLYGGHGVPQPGTYSQGGTHPGYGQQEQYGKPPSYGMPAQGPTSQTYGQPRPNQPGDMPYQGTISSTQSYGQIAPSQQPYPYASSGPMQQSYPPYGSAPATDGYNQPPSAAASVAGYPQQGSQTGYGQPGAQQAPGYAQVGPTGGYGQYPSSQTGYNEQAAQNNAGYGYQGPTDPAYGSGAVYGAPPSGQQGYAQPAPTQPGYDQSVPQSGGHGSVPGSMPVAYGKSLSPQPGYPPQYDTTQMYGAHR